MKIRSTCINTCCYTSSELTSIFAMSCFSLLKSWFKNCRIFYTWSGLGCEQREDGSDVGWEQSLHVWIRAWICWNVLGISSLQSWIFCGWTILFRLLSKRLQIFVPHHLHQPNMIASLPNDWVLPGLGLISVHYMESDVDTNVLRG